MMNMLQQQQQEKHNTNIDKQIQKQMGCMGGFFHLFHRHHFLSRKRLSGPSPPPLMEDSKEAGSETTKTAEASPTRIPAAEVTAPIENSTNSPLLPVYELKQGTRSSWKFAKDAPRLSLDSRAVVDAKGTLHHKANGDDGDCDKQRKSTSVIARLMGLDTLQDDQDLDMNKAPQLRRSASESRVKEEVFNCQFIDPDSFKLKQNQQQKQSSNAASRGVDLRECIVRNVRTQNKVLKGGGVLQRRSFFDSADFFPEPKQHQCVSIYSEIERRLKMRGIDEPSSKDLESLKHILEALQLKGLLHSKNSNNSQRNLNFVYGRDESPIVVMKPGRTRSPLRSAGIRGNPNQDIAKGRTSSPTRSESNVRSTSPTIRQRKPLSAETQRRVNARDQQQQRRSSSPTSVQSPRISSPQRTGQDNQISSRSSRNQKTRAEFCSSNKEKLMISSATEDESSTLSDSVSTYSQTDTERLTKLEEHRDGRSLLERCDKLLHSIAEMATTSSSGELQPSPVSVLDSSFYNEELSPSPVMKRSLEFKELPAEPDDDIWSCIISEDNREDGDYIYILEVLRALKYLPEDSDVFSLLEKQQHIKQGDTSKVSRLERKLIFDTLNEILDRERQLPPWKTAISGSVNSSQIWSEFQKIRERDNSEQDLFKVICGVLKKDLARDAITGWEDSPVEMSEAVLDIERSIFKDLISETIQDLASCSVNSNRFAVSRRKLVF